MTVVTITSTITNTVVAPAYCEGLGVPLCPNFISAVPDKPALSARLYSTDIIIVRYNVASWFSSFTQTGRSMMFNQDEDGYPGGVPAAVSAILNTANIYSVTELSYNAEGLSPAEILARLIAIRAELINQGDTRPLIMAPIYSMFLTQHANFAPYCDGFAIQLQNQTAGGEGAQALDAVTKAVGDMTPKVPIMYIQVSCKLDNRTLEQVVTSVNDVSAISGVSFVNMFFGNVANWSLCDAALDILRP
jgi:hypothetical protein